MYLETILQALPRREVIGSTDREVRTLVWDSRVVQPGDVFVALKERLGHDGHRFIQSANDRGAIAIVHENQHSSGGATSVRVPDTHLALALLSDRFWNSPSASLTLIGVTGTNGKTTITYLVESMLLAAGLSVGVIGTAGNRLNGSSLPGPTSHTTPYPPALQAHLRTIVDHGGQYAVMEASSHGLALHRVAGMKFQVACFTNLTRDHLDFHPDFNAYREAKKLLFSEYLSKTGSAVINADDPLAEEFAAASLGTPLLYGARANADLQLKSVSQLSARGSQFTVRLPDGTLLDVAVPLVGRFNVSNTLAAIGIGVSLRIPIESILAGVQQVSVPGRMERVDCAQPFSVLVDYAHTPDALRSALTSAREWTKGRVIVVFGCGGDRDPGKRPEMGRIAVEGADFTIVTSDNPRTESPSAILKDIVQGMPAKAQYLLIEDRGLAITEALCSAKEGDTVLIAGKGHETYQLVGSTKLDFDDRLVARSVLHNRFGVHPGITE